jgi:diacylglycerol kinase (ATP)
MRLSSLGPIERLVSAGGHSCKGLAAAWRTQPAIRYELCALVLIFPLGWWLGHHAVERALLIGSGLWVVVVELLNSAIETAVDRIGEEYHELSGRAKDMGSAAVLCSVVFAILIWLIILL